MPLTKSQINKLGDEIRHLPPHDPLPDAALARLQEFRSYYDAPLVEAESLVRVRLRFDTTSRLKTVTTIVEKLRRERMRLSEMQDIAGLRIVLEGGLTEQDSLTEALRELFPVSRVVDRRAQPIHGYRAVHVVPLVSGLPVEVQIRTRLQDLWAQAFERVADKAGRGIRYGVVPPQWADQVEQLQWASEDVAAIETNDRNLLLTSQMLRGLLERPARQAASGQKEIRQYQERQRYWERRSPEIKREIRAKLTAVIEGTEDLT